MGCSSCGTKTKDGKPGGCKSNGTCGTSGCNKLNVYDWLSDIELPENYVPFNIVEINFKGGRKEYYRNTNNLELYNKDLVIVDSEMGYDVGSVSLKGELVKLQLKKRGITEEQVDKNIQRVATEKEIEKYQEAKFREAPILERARTIALQLGLAMKLSDIEFQGDNRKVVFFYTAENRVDFRELIKQYADEFKVRIEMRQIGFRNEAARLGGIGSCGRELCCSTWMTDFKQVHTPSARTQNLSINMLKLSGQCGKLKCCLNFELDLYTSTLEEFPKSKNVILNTENGNAYLQKVDILKKLMWFQTEGNSQWIPLSVSQVNAYIKTNEQGKKIPALQPIETVEKTNTTRSGVLINPDDTLDLLGEDVGALDRKTKQKNQSKKPNRNNPPNHSNNPRPANNNPNANNRGNATGPGPGNNNNPNKRRRPPNKGKGPNNGPKPS
jgi:cell fate regulator YaaT (PSP1 superfamily)